MSIRVATHSECDRCGALHERPGAEGFTPPLGWASIHLMRHNRSGASSTILLNGILCDDCTFAIAGAMVVEKKP